MSCYAMRRIGQIIQQQGKAITFRRVTRTGGANPVITNTDYAVKAFLPDYDVRLINGTTVKVGDLRVIMAPTAIDGTALPAPTPTDFIIIDGAAPRSIGIVKPLYTGPNLTAYDVQAKG